MRDNYKTLKQEGRANYTDRRSEFIGIARPVATGIEAEAFVDEIRSKYPDARHHVYAWLTAGTEKLQKYSDDGEPRGTGGLPVLDVLLKQNIEDAAIVVVRYFGGVLLGTGGLVRAYGAAAAMAVEKAIPQYMEKLQLYSLTAPYSAAEKLRYLLKEAGLWQSEASYDLDVEWDVGVPAERFEELSALVQDATSGAALIEFKKTAFMPQEL